MSKKALWLPTVNKYPQLPETAIRNVAKYKTVLTHAYGGYKHVFYQLFKYSDTYVQAKVRVVYADGMHIRGL